MKILSITFHITDGNIEKWNTFLSIELRNLFENLIDVERYIFSEVDSKMIQEGKNYNVILFFENETLRADFIEFELPHIAEKIENNFKENVMIFPTFLDPLFERFM